MILMLKMTDESANWLKENLPNVLDMTEINDALDAISYAIDEKGFAPPDFYDYNDFGRKAQSIRDDLFISSLSENELEEYMNKLDRNYE